MTEDEETMQAAKTLFEELWSADPLADAARGHDIRLIAEALRSERARTQADLAAAWVAGRDAAIAQLKQTRDIIECAHAVNPMPSRKHDMDLLDEQIDAIRALRPPAEFAAPEDPRDAEIASLRAQLAERDELLREIKPELFTVISNNAFTLCARIDTLLKTETAHD